MNIPSSSSIQFLMFFWIHRKILQEKSCSSGFGCCSHRQNYCNQSILASATFGKISARFYCSHIANQAFLFLQGWSRNCQKTHAEIPSLLVPSIESRKIELFESICYRKIMQPHSRSSNFAVTTTPTIIKQTIITISTTLIICIR